MKRAATLPIVGVLAAIAITTAMDANGMSAYSALPLFPLMAVLWYVEKLSRRSVGFVWGSWRPYGLAALCPVFSMGAIALIASASGAIDPSQADWKKAGLNFAIVTASTVIVAILTEEGFFRGWLWASLESRGVGKARIVLWTSLAFALWHVSAVVLKTGFETPKPQVPVYLLNAAVIGAVWGLLRWMSGSLIVTSVSHGLWNGMAYVFYGFGTKVGVLGIKNTALYGPEVGILGLTLNTILAAGLWRWWRRRGTAERPAVAAIPG